MYWIIAFEETSTHYGHDEPDKKKSTAWAAWLSVMRVQMTGGIAMEKYLDTLQR